MTKLNSKLENTYIKGILIKKGISEIKKEDYEKISKSPVFQNYVRYGHVAIAGEQQEATTEIITLVPDFSLLEYNELRKYVTKYGLEPETTKKEGLIKALDDYAKEHKIEIKTNNKEGLIEALNSLEGVK